MHHKFILEKMWVHSAQIIVSMFVYTQNVASWLAEAIMGIENGIHRKRNNVSL
jgi:hypothetical protein